MIGEWAEWLLVTPPFLLGYLTGFIVKLVRLVWSAMVEGFDKGSTI
jgi:hypothetical protein